MCFSKFVFSRVCCRLFKKLVEEGWEEERGTTTTAARSWTPALVYFGFPSQTSFYRNNFSFFFSNFFLVCVLLNVVSLSLRSEIWILFLPTFLEIHSPKKVTRFYLSVSSSSCWLIIGLTKCSDATPHFYISFFFSNRTRRSLIAAA
jgi:hypothetical protein